MDLLLSSITVSTFDHCYHIYKFELSSAFKFYGIARPPYSRHAHIKTKVLENKQSIDSSRKLSEVFILARISQMTRLLWFESANVKKASPPMLV